MTLPSEYYHQGIDILSVQRIQATIERRGKRFLDRVFTDAEQAYCDSKRMKYEHYAARFSAKEAFMKAAEVRKRNRYCFHDIEVRRHATGKPYIYLTEKARKKFLIPENVQMELSMTHEREYAAAIVMIVSPDSTDR